MRKYIIGTLFGIVLTLTSSVFADNIKSLIGSKIQGEFPIAINGKSLEKRALVINGGSYLPVRDMGDALGLDVTFNADMGIELKQKESGQEVMPVANHSVNNTITSSVYEDVQGKIQTIDIGINSVKQILSSFENQLGKLNNKANKSEIDNQLINETIKDIEKTKESIMKLEQKKAALTK